MMNTILVWILVTVGPSSYGQAAITYSPPMADLESCQRLADNLYKYVRQAQCVQIKVVK